MKSSTKTLLYVLGGLVTLVGGGTAIYFATRDDQKTVVKAPPAPAIPIVDTSTPQAEALTQADIEQQKQNQQQQQPQPPPSPPSIQLLQNLSQII